MRTKRLITFGILAAVVGGSGFLLTRPAPPVPLSLFDVTTSTVRAEVSGTGSVQPARVVALSFAGQGRVGEVNVVAGDAVVEGQVLGSLDANAARLDVDAKQEVVNLAERKRSAVTASGRLDRQTNEAQTQQAVVQSQSNKTLVAEAQQVRTAATESAVTRFAAAETQAINDLALRESDRVRHEAAQTKLTRLTTVRDEARTGLTTAKSALANANLRRDEARAAVELARGPLAKLTLARDDARRALEKAVADLDRSRAMNPDAAANGVFFSDSLVVAAREKFNVAEREYTAQELVVADVQRAYELTLTGVGQAETAQSNAQARVDLADGNLTSQTATVEATQRSLETSTETARRSSENVDVVRRANAAERARDDQTVKQSLASAKQADAATRLARQQATLRDKGTRPVELLGVTAELDAARQALKQAEDRLGQLEIRAPFTGIVSSVSVKAGEIAGAATQLPGVVPTGTPSPSAFTLIDSSLLSVRVGFPDVDLARIMVGQRSKLRFDALADVEVFGTVASIEPSPTIVNNVSTTYVRIAFDGKPEGLRVGMAATAKVIVGETPNAMVVPASALTENVGVLQVRKATREQGEPATRKPTTANTRIETVVVTTGERSDGNVQIVSGLAVGDQVVLPEGAVAR